MKPSTFAHIWSLWPPYLFAGIRVLSISDDARHARVRLRRHWWNRNAFDTHFGGSLLAMVNPFWPLMVRENLGPGYVVWDTKNEIDFIKAMREDVFAEFRLDLSLVEEIRAAAANGEKVLRWFPFEIANARAEVAARGRVEVYVRRKREKSPQPSPGTGGGMTTEASGKPKPLRVSRPRVSHRCFGSGATPVIACSPGLLDLALPRRETGARVK